MLLSLNWLRDYLLKPDVRIDPKDLAEKLTMRGLSVSSIKRPSLGLDFVVVGRIEKIDKHPNADRLQVTTVILSEGSNAQRYQIVCGAKNIAEGDVVPIALPGAVLPGNLAIKQSTIRGVESGGMICSGKELGLSDDSEGILQLPKHSELGLPLAHLMGTDDILLEFELTPNRADCLSIIGLAREIAPLLRTKLRDPKPPRFRSSAHRTSSIIKVEVEDPNVCPRYVARVIDGLKVTESPDWIKQRLQTVGIRPINNIVDITNFVMLEYGVPLHPFDLRKIQSGMIRVATCKQPTDMTLLNQNTVGLQEGDILILDGDRPIALAGIMGGSNSQIESDTTSIVLESAAFLPTQIRRTAKRLGLITDASKRFEKGVDLNAIALASERAAVLLRDTFSANVYHPAIDTDEYAGKEHVISLDMRDVRKFAGLPNITAETASDLLDSIGITSQKKSINVLSVKMPSFRVDLKESIDLVEEVARLNGYDTIPEYYPLSQATYDKWDESQFKFEMRLKGFVSQWGLRETIHYSFTSEENLRKYGFDNDRMVKIKNPLSEEMKVMRTSLLPSLLQTYLYNRNRRVTNQKLFEVGRIYYHDDQEDTRVREIGYLAGLLSGDLLPPTWKTKKEEVDFYFAKGLVDNVVRQMSTVYLAYEPLKGHRLFHPNRSATLRLGLKEVGFIGEVHPFIKQQVLETEEPLVIFELNLDALRKYERMSNRFKPVAKYPSVEIDVAFVLDKAVTSHSFLEAVRHSAGALLSDAAIFDVYEGDNIPMGKKSLACRLNFLSPDRTLQEEEVTQLRDKISQNLKDKFGALMRA